MSPSQLLQFFFCELLLYGFLQSYKIHPLFIYKINHMPPPILLTPTPNITEQ
jgi:hypothetical protein